LRESWFSELLLGIKNGSRTMNTGASSYLINSELGKA
jgi:hypothetical protein